MSPHRRVYINYSSALEVMGTQLQMLEKNKKRQPGALRMGHSYTGVTVLK